MRIIATILATVLFGACGSSNLNTELEQTSRDEKLMEKSVGSAKSGFPERESPALNEPHASPFSSGFGYSAPGVKAAHKEFWTQIGDAKKAVNFQLDFIGDTEIFRSASSSALEMKWTLLAESQDMVDRLADSAIPDGDDRNPEFYQLTIKQIEGCRGYSVIKSNGSANYMVQGTCITHPSISIPNTFGNKIFLNGKLIHDGNAK